MFVVPREQAWEIPNLPGMASGGVPQLPYALGYGIYVLRASLREQRADANRQHFGN
jgi:hypothetical protein